MNLAVVKGKTSNSQRKVAQATQTTTHDLFYQPWIFDAKT
jgi:hypothetical protein